jgi:hypothetical protein
MNIIEQILELPVFAENPPVLLDIGASGAIHPKWQPIAKYSICIAFDADDREFGYAVNESKGFKKLYLFNSLVTASASGVSDFYLTHSPYCSSLLEPDLSSLSNYNFGDLFEVDRVVRLNAVQLLQALHQIGVTKIDWLKTDSQGTDLRLFASLGEEMISKTLLAEFEPGIIDGYKGEDKLHALMGFMDRHPFWMNDIKICGTQRIDRISLFRQFHGYDGKQLDGLPFRTSPCWAEVSYFNVFGIEAQGLTIRDYLLGWVFALIEGQYGFALDLALEGSRRFNQPIFDVLVHNATELVVRTQ